MVYARPVEILAALTIAALATIVSSNVKRFNKPDVWLIIRVEGDNEQ